MTGYTSANTPASEAVTGALRDHGTLDRPDPKIVLKTFRCPKGHLLGRVISTRCGPVWMARPKSAPGNLILPKKAEGVSLGANNQWEFEFLTRGSLPARCRCGGWQGEWALAGGWVRDVLGYGGQTVVMAPRVAEVPEASGR